MSAQPFRATRIKVTLITRPLLMPVTQKLCRREHAELNVHCRTPVSTETVCCSRSIWHWSHISPSKAAHHTPVFSNELRLVLHTAHAY